ncbi:hypothetical protein Agabi119p4_498 [Agaricus bisporus var. burnettii]|uniref:Anaphase-promoting complex subunit 4 n=1 Tax=Agaricus bisporus var. burnettii TaxID=192524 RepID=A0A8H7FAP5_AGABI|nr:hypothetical protein Agabi119p4_498 [Agaricus bisporus var. burnettii]
MSTTAFNTLATFQLPTPCRILPTSCCLDKDLVLLISRLGSLDRISLWNTTQGTKIWEVEVGEDANDTHVVDLAWSPDGQSVAVLYEPLNISIHSIQDGKRLYSLPVGNKHSQSSRKQAIGISIRWFKDEQPIQRTSIPDIFKRNGLITGSSLSILKALPLLDSLPDDYDRPPTADIFTFQGSHPRTSQRDTMPDAVRDWPTLVSDPLLASICPPGHQPTSDRTVSDDPDVTNRDSLLVVADDDGHLWCYQDGAFPLGRVQVGKNMIARCLYRVTSSPSILWLNVAKSAGDNDMTALCAVQVDLPLLRQRFSRELSQLSSTARDLTWYAMRVVKEMKTIWFGSDMNGGAREWGPRWLRSLETKQKEKYGQEESIAILDLTCLLVTGRSSISLADFLGSGEQTSERNIQKWETSMTESLGKLRDCAEKQLAPALQRLHLVLEEIQGWSLLPQYRAFELSYDHISSILDFATRGVICASWLSVTARREFTRFREFISWLRFEITNANPTNESHAIPRHDILEVNAYLMSGLVVSSIDKWFIGPVPKFTPRDLGIPVEDTRPFKLVLEQIHNVAGNPEQLDWQADGTRRDLSHLDRNLDSLIQELASRCQLIFARAGAAASRSASVSTEHLATSFDVPAAEYGGLSSRNIRERVSTSKEREAVQHFASPSPDDKSILLLARLRFDPTRDVLPNEISIGVIQCHFPGDEEQGNAKFLEVEFFDDENLVIICQSQNSGNLASIAIINYVDVGYQELELANYVKCFREDLMNTAMNLWRKGELTATLCPLEKRRVVHSSRSVGFSMAVNGRVGRRVACVLDNTGTSMESFDMEGEVEDMEVGSDA